MHAVHKFILSLNGGKNYDNNALQIINNVNFLYIYITVTQSGFPNSSGSDDSVMTLPAATNIATNVQETCSVYSHHTSL